MSLYGALFTGVSGLNAQGQKIAIISDNISNVNTVGYKEGQAQFQTLVVNATTQSAYSPGGVRNTTRVNVDKQGIISSTSAPTDIAVSGNGFFVVNASADGSAQALYTRAGSFRQDAQGNFVNSQGFFLQGWPLDREGRLPGEPGNLNTISNANLQSLRTVNVENAGGVAQATTQIRMGINLDAGQDIQKGAGAVADMDPLSAINFGIDASTIIAPSEFGIAPTNSIRRGDAFTVSTVESGLSYNYIYGGFVVGRSVDDGTLADTDANSITNPNTVTVTPVADPANLTGGAGSGSVTMAFPAATIADMQIGNSITFNADVPLTDGVDFPNTVFTVIAIDTVNNLATLSFDSAGATLPTAGNVAIAFGAAPEAYISRFTGNMFDASGVNQRFFGSTTNLSTFTQAARSFTISNASLQDGTATFTYVASSPNTQQGQFNSLTTLAEAINNTSGLTARVADGRLIVGAENASEAVTFANVDATGDGTLNGINWIQELGLINIDAADRRFSTLGGLQKLADADEGVSAVISNPLADATLEIFSDDPLEQIIFRDFQSDPLPLNTDPLTTPVYAPAVAPASATVTFTINRVGHGLTTGQSVTLAGFPDLGGPAPDVLLATEINSTFTVTVIDADNFTITVPTASANDPAIPDPSGGGAGTLATGNFGSILAELGIVDSLDGDPYVRGDTGILGPVYDAAGVSGRNLSSGDLTAHFSRTITVYDPLGAGHDLRVAFLKIGENRWAVELFAIDPTSVNTTRPNGQVASGVIEFNGDASLKSVSGGLLNPININWTNGAAPSTIELDLGNAGLPFGTPGATIIGDTTGLSQFDSTYNVAFLQQNGAPVGDLVSVTISPDGFVVASFSNGETQNLFKIPLADFTNPNGLKPISGNVFAETAISGNVNLREAGTSGVGDIVSNALEESNVDLAEQLTNMIVAQRAYQSNTRVIRTTDELLEQLNQL